MSGLVDLHVHLLPAVDDGPATLRESLDHAARMAAAGVREATVTPHIGHPDFDVRVDELPARTAQLQRNLLRAGIDLRVHPGGEIHPRAAERLSTAELDTIGHGPPGRRWVLLEAPFAGIDDVFVEGCGAIRHQGFGVLIAHPERCRGFLEDGWKLLTSELEHGALLQVNTRSALGRNGPEARTGAETLIRNGHAAVVASDGHGARRRDTLLDGYAAAVATGVAPEVAHGLTCSYPSALLRQGWPVPIATAAWNHFRPTPPSRHRMVVVEGCVHAAPRNRADRQRR